LRRFVPELPQPSRAEGFPVAGARRVLDATLKTEGSLVESDFPDLVQDLQKRRWTGVLTLTHMGIGKSVTVQDGRLVFASSSSPDDRLGELLLRKGKITLRQYVDAGKAIGPGKRLGAILVEHGVLPPKDLVKGVVDQTQEIIYSVFQWTEGRFRLQEGQVPSESIMLNISTPDIILEGVRRIETWSRIDKGVGGIAARYVRSEDYEKLIGNMTLSFERLSLLTELKGTCDVEAICKASSLTSFEVCRTLWAFRVIGVVKRIDPPEAVKPSTIVEDEGLGSVLADG